MIPPWEKSYCKQPDTTYKYQKKSQDYRGLDWFFTIKLKDEYRNPKHDH